MDHHSAVEVGFNCTRTCLFAIMQQTDTVQVMTFAQRKDRENISKMKREKNVTNCEEYHFGHREADSRVITPYRI